MKHIKKTKSGTRNFNVVFNKYIYLLTNYNLSTVIMTICLDTPGNSFVCNTQTIRSSMQHLHLASSHKLFKQHILKSLIYIRIQMNKYL